MEHEGYLNIAEVAAKMRVSDATVWGLIKRRSVDRYKFPGDRRTYVAAGDYGALAEPEKLPSASGAGRPRGSGEASKEAA